MITPSILKFLATNNQVFVLILSFCLSKHILLSKFFHSKRRGFSSQKVNKSINICSFFDWTSLAYKKITPTIRSKHHDFFVFFQDRGSEPSSPNEAVNPLDAAVKARRKDKDEEKESGGT